MKSDVLIVEINNSVLFKPFRMCDLKNFPFLVTHSMSFNVYRDEILSLPINQSMKRELTHQRQAAGNTSSSQSKVSVISKYNKKLLVTTNLGTTV